MNREKKTLFSMNNVSIFKYVVSFVIAVISVVCFVTVATIVIVTSRAIPDEVRRDLSVENRRVERALKKIDGRLVVEDYKTDYVGYSYAVCDEAGNPVIGDIPKGVKFGNLGERTYYFDSVKTDDGYMYVKRDIIRNPDLQEQSSEKRLYIYGFINESKVSTIYNRIRKTSLLIIITLFIILGLFMMDITKRMIKPIDKMYETAKRVSNSMDFAETIDENSIFVEINTLIHAYNELFERIRITYDMQKRFNSDVSHELKTPIAVMSAQCQIAKQKYADDEYALEMITVLERQTNIMNDLVTQLLQLSRIDNDSIELYSDVVDMNDLVDVVCEDLEISFDGFNSVIKDVNIREIQGNIVLIFTVVRNLLNNAVRYNMDNNPVNISVRAEDNDMIIVVKDHGIGIPKEDIPIVFDAFYRGEESRSSEGFGLGLTLTKRIVECYGGRITVNSELNKGSEFTVRMPVVFTDEDN